MRVRPALLGATIAPGDGHATLESQAWLSRREKRLFARDTIYVKGTHFGMITREENLAVLFDLLER